MPKAIDGVRKSTDPTSKRSQLGAKESDIDQETLHQKFKNLQKEWESYKYRSKNPRVLRQCSTDSRTIVIDTLQLMNNYSPSELMASLQRRRSPPSEGFWKVRNNDMVVQEILRERWAAIESGNLKGKRLFADFEGATGVGFEEREEICSDWLGLIQENQESEMSSVCSSYGSHDDNGDCGRKEGLTAGCYCCSGSSVSDERVEMRKKEVVGGGEKVVVGVEEKRKDSGEGGASGGRWMITMGWFAIVLLAFTLAIVSIRCNGGYVDQDEVILVPT
ncbi:unnamed protein product [Ilex paraguariensis]|uniref:Uncharacterized protein n=1 Tax=Ilex paraguariensis TaxID=185542 RepID=A0ABC8TMV2_9AQUA